MILELSIRNLKEQNDGIHPVAEEDSDVKQVTLGVYALVLRHSILRKHGHIGVEVI